MLFINNIKSKKLNQNFLHKFIKSFRIVEIMNKQVYHLIIFSFYRIHDVIHVFYLKLYKRRKDDNIISKFFSFEFLDDDKINEIKKILQKKSIKELSIIWLNEKTDQKNTMNEWRKKTWMRLIYFKNLTSDQKKDEKSDKHLTSWLTFS